MAGRPRYRSAATTKSPTCIHMYCMSYHFETAGLLHDSAATMLVPTSIGHIDYRLVSPLQSP